MVSLPKTIWFLSIIHTKFLFSMTSCTDSILRTASFRTCWSGSMINSLSMISPSDSLIFIGIYIIEEIPLPACCAGWISVAAYSTMMWVFFSTTNSRSIWFWHETSPRLAKFANLSLSLLWRLTNFFWAWRYEPMEQIIYRIGCSLVARMSHAFHISTTRKIA